MIIPNNQFPVMETLRHHAFQGFAEGGSSIANVHDDADGRHDNLAGYKGCRKSEVRVVRAFRPAFKLFIVIGSESASADDSIASRIFSAASLAVPQRPLEYRALEGV